MSKVAEMAIPFLSLREQTASIKRDVMMAIESVIDGQGFANGPAVEAFERQFAEYLGVREAICVNTGTTSLQAALIACGVATSLGALAIEALSRSRVRRRLWEASVLGVGLLLLSAGAIRHVTYEPTLAGGTVQEAESAVGR